MLGSCFWFLSFIPLDLSRRELCDKRIESFGTAGGNMQMRDIWKSIQLLTEAFLLLMNCQSPIVEHVTYFTSTNYSVDYFNVMVRAVIDRHDILDIKHHQCSIWSLTHESFCPTVIGKWVLLVREVLKPAKWSQCRQKLQVLWWPLEVGIDTTFKTTKISAAKQGDLKTFKTLLMHRVKYDLMNHLLTYQVIQKMRWKVSRESRQRRRARMMGRMAN